MLPEKSRLLSGTSALIQKFALPVLRRPCFDALRIATKQLTFDWS